MDHGAWLTLEKQNIHGPTACLQAAVALLLPNKGLPSSPRRQSRASGNDIRTWKLKFQCPRRLAFTHSSASAVIGCMGTINRSAAILISLCPTKTTNNGLLVKQRGRPDLYTRPSTQAPPFVSSAPRRDMHGLLPSTSSNALPQSSGRWTGDSKPGWCRRGTVTPSQHGGTAIQSESSSRRHFLSPIRTRRPISTSRKHRPLARSPSRCRSRWN